MDKPFQQSLKLPITFAMITLNEEDNLRRLLPKLRELSDHILVVDSFSSDSTKEICEEWGVDFHTNEFQGFGSQWNYVLTLATVNDWIMKIDPDEELSKELIKDIRRAIQSDTDTIAYKMKRLLYFGGQPSPAYDIVTRLWRVNKGVQFGNVLVNEHLLVPGKVSKLNGVIRHFDVPIKDWILKQLNYAELESDGKSQSMFLNTTPKIFSLDGLSRRMWFKKWLNRIPMSQSAILVFYFLKFYRGRNFKALIFWLKGRLVVSLLKELIVYEKNSESLK